MAEFARVHYWSRNAVGQEFEPVWSLNVALSKKAMFPHKMCEEQFKASEQLLCSSELFSLILQSRTLYCLPSANHFFDKSHLNHSSCSSSSLCQTPIARSTLGYAIQALLSIPILQPPFDIDVAHPITDLRLYTYKGVNHIQRIVFWTSRILLHLVKP